MPASSVARLADAMPDPNLLDQIRQVALNVPGTAGVEKLFARNTGLQYHVDLHLEVDPEMTVHQAHEIAHEVRFAIRRQLDWVADVLVHVEPAPGPPVFNLSNRHTTREFRWYTFHGHADGRTLVRILES